MVRVASLASFPKALITRDFYAPTPLDAEADSPSEVRHRRRERDRCRKRRLRQAARQRQMTMPREVLALFRRNGGEI